MSEARKVVITGGGVLSALGIGRREVFRCLLEGRNGLREPEGVPEDWPRLGWVGGRVGALNGSGPETVLEGGNLRPLDRPSRLATAAVQLALADGGVGPAEPTGEDSPVGLVLGTMFGSVRTIAEFDRRGLQAGPKYVKPFDFANSVINAAAGQAAIWHRLGGVNATVAGGPVAGLEAIALASDLVANGSAELVLAGGADELCPESLLGFARAGLSGRERPVPFDAARDGFAPAEGAALLLLEEEGSARRRGARILAHVRGVGGAFDPSRGRDRESGVAAVARAVSAALAEAGIGPEAIEALSSGGSGSVDSDRREALGVARALGEERCRRLPVTAVKSMLGESLGASGALQTMALLGAMEEGRLPGIRGLDGVEEELPLDGVSDTVREVEVRRGLVTAVGIDGAAAAVVLEAGQVAP